MEIVSSSLCERRNKKTRGKGQKTWRPGWRVRGIKHGEETDEERYRETRKNTGGNIRKAGKVVCETGLREKDTRGQRRATGAIKSLQRPDRGKERQAIYRAGGERQGQVSQGERRRWKGGQEQEDGVTAGKRELNRRVEAEGARR